MLIPKNKIPKTTTTILTLALLGLAGWVFINGLIRFPKNTANRELVASIAPSPENTGDKQFNGELALEDVHYQVSLGPRIPGSVAHERIISWLGKELTKAEWDWRIQEATRMGKPVQNLIARRGGRGQGIIILGAHYDSRLVADRDPDPQKAALPVPGANDGASGVAVLLELARSLPKELEKEIWLVFFDVEDNGRLPGWDWILGSRAFVEQLEIKPQAAIIVDMIGDADLQIYKEKNSTPELVESIWAQARELGYTQFMPEAKHSILDDHTPFLEAGIPAADIIDFDFPYHHTSEDTPDKVSAESLDAVGDTLYAWLTKP